MHSFTYITSHRNGQIEAVQVCDNIY